LNKHIPKVSGDRRSRWVSAPLRTGTTLWRMQDTEIGDAVYAWSLSLGEGPGGSAPPGRRFLGQPQSHM